MKRREFITLLGGVSASWPLAARAQQRAMPVIGLLSQRSLDDPATPLQMDAFRQGLKEAGFEEGKNARIEYRWAAGHYDQLPAFAADLVRRKVKVIVAHAGTNAVVAAKAATSTIPIVFVAGGDPVKLGFVARLNHPGGNVTGVNVLSEELFPKRLQLLIEIVPKITTVAALVNPAYATADVQLRLMEDAGGALGRHIVILNASTEDEIDSAFTSAAQQQASGIVIGGDPFFNIHVTQLVTQTARRLIPAVFPVREFPVAGGLMSYGTNYNAANRIVGEYVGRILKGAIPADLPVQQSTKVELVINLKTAKALGLTVPLPLLARADEVIE
jgi:putative ABC transport system substrate-binding protein